MAQKNFLTVIPNLFHTTDLRSLYYLLRELWYEKVANTLVIRRADSGQ